VGAVDGDCPAPSELSVGWQCERFGCLPEAGGYLDQEYVLMHRMSVLMNIYAAYAHYRGSHGAQIHNLSDSERRVLRQLKDMGILFKA
jgi:ABC-type phosphate/phosphonate transport system ATPase subunit